MNVYLKALGCRLNEAELESWANEFDRAGHIIVNHAAEADLTVLNTCAVTTEAVRKSRKLINRTRRENPAAKLVVSGCFVATGEAGNAADLGADLLIDNNAKSTLVQSVTQRFQIPIMPEGATRPNEYSLFARNRQRAFIKIQDGCRYRCSYCIVTIARGAEISRSLNDITDEVNALVAKGVREIVLTGVHVGGYGSDINSNLKTLVRTLLENTDVPRIRFASVEPWDLGDDFFTLFENSRLMPHMHLPLQSGCDSVLRRMSRRCHTEDFSNLVQTAKQTIANFNVTTDIIVGFPAESDKEWQDTLNFVADHEFGHIHIFSFSPRTGTKAATMSDQVEESVKRLRSQQLHQLASGQRLTFLDRNIGQRVPILWEGPARGKNASAMSLGYTPNYIRVAAPINAETTANVISNHTIESIDKNGSLAITKR